MELHTLMECLEHASRGGIREFGYSDNLCRRALIRSRLRCWHTGFCPKIRLQHIRSSLPYFKDASVGYTDADSSTFFLQLYGSGISDFRSFEERYLARTR